VILEIALGIVLGFLLLALLPLILAGTITIVKWLAIGAIVVAVVAVLYTYPSQIIGTALVITASILLVALWVVVPRRLANSNNPLAQRLIQLHSNFMALLDNKPPFQGMRWLPARILVVGIAITATTFLAMSALITLGVVWNYAP